MRASDWDPILWLIMLVVIVLAPIWIALAIIAAVLTMIAQLLASFLQLIASILQFLWQIIVGIVVFIQSIPQPVWWLMFLSIGVFVGTRYVAGWMPATQRLATAIKKNPALYLGAPIGFLVLTLCCVIVYFGVGTVTNFITLSLAHAIGGEQK